VASRRYQPAAVDRRVAPPLPANLTPWTRSRPPLLDKLHPRVSAHEHAECVCVEYSLFGGLCWRSSQRTERSEYGCNDTALPRVLCEVAETSKHRTADWV
jgi:hypothetical protein